MGIDERNGKAAQIGNGVFFIGLGLLFLTGWWWPGIIAVIAASILGRSLAGGQCLKNVSGIFWLIGIALVFSIPGLIGSISGALWRWLPLILVGVGLYMLFGGRSWPRAGHRDDEKPKHKRKNDEDGDIHQV